MCKKPPLRTTEERNKLAEANLALVGFVLGRLRRQRVDVAALDAEDASQVGTLGLLRAAQKFDASRGFKFSTFACRCVANAVIEEAERQRRRRERQPALLRDGAEFELEAPPEPCSLMSAEVEALLAELPPTQARALWEHVALQRTLHDVGAEEGCGREAIRQRCVAGLERLRLMLAPCPGAPRAE